MIKIKSGVIQKVLTEEQFKKISSGELDPKDITIFDTIRTRKTEDGSIVEYLPIKLSSKEVDKKGNVKFVENEETGEKNVCYQITNIMNAYGKEMRILLDMDEYSPVKVAVEENNYEFKKSYKVLCIQNQLSGKLD